MEYDLIDGKNNVFVEPRGRKIAYITQPDQWNGYENNNDR